MKLKEYLELPEKSATKLATGCGCSVSAITRAANGDTIPNRELMASIFRETGGLVTPNDFFDVDAVSAPTDRPASDTAPGADAVTA